MSQSIFQDASKEMAKAKIAVIGPAGAGKTLSSLLMARGLTNNGRVAVLDSENGSASLYADKFPGWKYQICRVNPPYTARKYLDVIQAAVREKYDCLIMDSLTHVWAGEGGLLQQKEAMDSRQGSNSFTNWQNITKVHEHLKSQILYSPIHIIATMRSKQEYVLETNDRGKSVPKKVGLKPIQRDDLDYEFTVVFDIGMDHQYIVSKDRTDLFDGMVAKMTEQTGIDIRGWLANDIQTPELAESKVDDVPEEAPGGPLPGKDAYPGGPRPTYGVEVKEDPMAGPTLTPDDFNAMKNARGTVGVTSIVEAKEKQQRQVMNHATGQMQEAPRLAPPTLAEEKQEFDSGKYVIKCGSNWGMKGKTILQINESTLTAALKQADGIIAKGSNDPDVKEFAYHARKFLREVGVAI